MEYENLLQGFLQGIKGRESVLQSLQQSLYISKLQSPLTKDIVNPLCLESVFINSVLAEDLSILE